MTIQHSSESGDKEPLAASKKDPIIRLPSFTHPGLGQSGLDFRLQALFRRVAHLKHKTLLRSIYRSVFRIGETGTLRVQDIRSDEGVTTIQQSKGKKDRRVPLSKSRLQQWHTFHEAILQAAFLFRGSQGGPYSQSSGQKILKEAVNKAEIMRHKTLYILRHSYATHLTNRVVNSQYLQEILGHNSPKTTMLYRHLSGKDIRSIKPLRRYGLMLIYRKKGA
jgi:site-specific recombinase XerD